MAEQKKDKGKPKKIEYKQGKMCPKCNCKMGEHSDRLTCGKCRYTEFKKHEPQK